MLRDVILTCGQERFRIDLSALCYYSSMLVSVVSNSSDGETVVLNGVSKNEFDHLYLFCVHHFKKEKKSKVKEGWEYDSWDKTFLARLYQQVNLVDFKNVCKILNIKILLNIL